MHRFPSVTYRAHRGAATALGVIGASAALGAVVTQARLSTGAILVLLTGVVLAAPIVSRCARGRFDIFEPVVVFCLTYALMFVVRPAYMLAANAEYFEISGTRVLIGSTITEMQVVGLIGAIGFVVGYGVGPSAWLARRLPSAPTLSAEQLGRAGLVVLAIGTAATALYIRGQGGLGAIFAGRSEQYFQAVSGTSGYLYYAPTLMVPAALLTFVAWRESGRWIYAWASLAGALVLFAARGPVGGRLAFLPLIAGAIIYLYFEKRRRPGLVALLIALPIAIGVWTVVGEVRNASTRAETGVQGTVASILREPSRVLDPVFEGPDAAMAPGLAAALRVVPEQIPHTYGGATFGDLLSRAIPRSVWPEKPLPPREQVVRVLWSEAYAASVANPEFSALFPWYLDGGLVGVALGLLLYGTLFRTAFRYFDAHGSNITVRLCFAILVPSIVMVLRDTPTDAVVRLTFMLGPIIGTALLLRGTQKARTRP